MATRIKASASAVRRRIKRRSERASHKKNTNATLRSRKQRAKKTARVMRGGAPKPVEIFFCYKGKKLGLIHDLEQRIINEQKITQRDVVQSIALFDISKLIGILFRRTVYDWKFCVFDEKIIQQEFTKLTIKTHNQTDGVASYVTVPDADILKAISGLAQYQDLSMNIPDSIAEDNRYNNNSGLRLFLSSRKSQRPWSNNLVLIDQAIGDKWIDRETLTVEKIAPMTETQDWLDNEDIHFLNFKKLPYSINSNSQNCDDKVTYYDSSTILHAKDIFDNRDFLCKLSTNILNNLTNFVITSKELKDKKCNNKTQNTKAITATDSKQSSNIQEEAIADADAGTPLSSF